jgi:protein Tex
MDTPIPVDLGRIAQDLQIRRVQVESVVQLLDEGNTVPFITRYRKERTGNLNEVAIHEIQLRVGRLRELAERKETILKAIEAQGKLSEDLAAAIRAADNSKRLEDLYLPFKPKKKTKASEARDKGLEPLAQRIWNRDETLTDLAAAAQELVSPEKGVETVEAALEGVGHILAEAISELAAVRDAVRRVVWKTGKVVTTKSEIPEGEGLEYRDYFNYSEPVAHIPPHRVLAINRGDKEGPLKVKLEVVRPELEAAAFSQLPLEGHPQGDFFRAAAADALDRLLLPSMEREVRRDLTELAERHAVDVFARNLRSLLLQPPIPDQVVLALDPGFRTGCKVAVLDGHGNLLDHGVIHPHPPQNRRSEAKVYLKDLVGKHGITVVAIGNGTACRETEELIAEIIQEGTTFSTDPEAAAAALAAATAHAQSHPPDTRPTAEEPVPADTSEAEAETAPVAEAPAAEAPTAEAPAPDPADGHPENGDVASEVPAEVLPPIVGGAPEEGETVVEAPAEPLAATEPPVVEAATPAPEPTPTPAPDAPATEATAEDDSVTAAVAPAAVSGATPPAGLVPAATAEPAGKGHGEGHGHGRKEKHRQENRPPRPKPVPQPPRPHPADEQLAKLAYVIVNEAGASVYSASPVGREEFPDFDATLRGTISIGRRLQDPLAELVKIEPQSIGVGLYQHDVNPKQLKESLESVISSCVNFVGVDLNTASIPLLRHVSGLNQLTARRVVEYRKEKGPFTDRDQLKEVEGVGPVTFTQAAGFLKIRNDSHPLDRTWVHPESYGVATKLLEQLGFGADVVKEKEKLPELHAKLNEVDFTNLAKELEVGELTLRDLADALARPDRDPREDLPKPIFKKGVLKLEDLQAGMELKGTVLNVVDFGAFVDIGLKDSGLVHISQLANRYIKSPHDVVSVGDVVTAWVMGVDQERKRVSLTMVKPGTERPRGGPGGGGGGGGGRRGGEGRGGPAPGQGQGGPGGERRGGAPGGGRPPRREGAPAGSALTTPPAGGSGAPSGGGPGGEGSGPPQHRPSGPPNRGFGGQRPGGGGGPGRGGPRSGPGGAGGGRFERTAPPPRPPVNKPAKPAVPPPPLSKEAITGSVPLRSFGQLKQLWQARTDDPVEGESQQQAPEASPPTEPPAETPGGEGTS